MAKQVDTEIEGTFGPVIFYKSKKKYLLRAKGNTGKQGEAAREQSRILGQASSLSARIRKAFKPILPGPVNRPMMYRFNNALQQWLRTGQAALATAVNDIPFLRGFSFSSSRGNELFHAAIPVSRDASGNLLLQLPAFDSPNPIHPLPFHGKINLHFIAVSCNLDDATDNGTFETQLDIAYTGIPIPAKEIIIPLQTQPGCITVVALSVNGMSKGVVGAMFN
jgi:hypothetical protein